MIKSIFCSLHGAYLLKFCLTLLIDRFTFEVNAKGKKWLTHTTHMGGIMM